MTVEIGLFIKRSKRLVYKESVIGSRVRNNRFLHILSKLANQMRAILVLVDTRMIYGIAPVPNNS